MDLGQPITALRAGVPMELQSIVGEALSKSAGERYQHIDEMLVAIESFWELLKEAVDTALFLEALHRCEPD